MGIKTAELRTLLNAKPTNSQLKRWLRAYQRETSAARFSRTKFNFLSWWAGYAR